MGRERSRITAQDQQRPGLTLPAGRKELWKWKDPSETSEFGREGQALYSRTGQSCQLPRDDSRRGRGPKAVCRQCTQPVEQPALHWKGSGQHTTVLTTAHPSCLLDISSYYVRQAAPSRSRWASSWRKPNEIGRVLCSPQVCCWPHSRS